MDGTFKIAPNLFLQIFVILGSRNGGIHPCIYVFLPNKEQETYRRLVVEIQILAAEIVVGSISVDFEVAIHNAFRNQFPETEIHGCFFHLLKYLKNKLGLQA